MPLAAQGPLNSSAEFQGTGPIVRDQELTLHSLAVIIVLTKTMAYVQPRREFDVAQYKPIIATGSFDLRHTPKMTGIVCGKRWNCRKQNFDACPEADVRNEGLGFATDRKLAVALFQALPVSD